MAWRAVSFQLGGGLDVVTPADSMPPGRVIGASNYEPDDQGGYRRIQGFERFSGKPSPSEASFWTVEFSSGTSAFVDGETITGGTSGASGKVLYSSVTAGGFPTSDAAGFVVFGDIAGAFQPGEQLLSGATVRAISSTTQAENRDVTGNDYAMLRDLAIAERRAGIGAVPGSGPIRGVFVSRKGDTIYAVRDNIAGTAGVIHYSTPAGWAALPLGESLAFTGGTDAFVEGDTVTGGTSGATGVLSAAGVTSGAFTGGDAAGTLYLTSATGTFQSGETISGSQGGSATAAGAQAATALPPGGRYEFIEHNFDGSADRYFVFGANGTGRAIRFNLSEFAMIHITGLTDANDKPEHVEAHKQHLFLSADESLFASSINNPMEYDAITDAAEFATGDRIVAINRLTGGVLAVHCRDSAYILYGDDSTNFDMQPYAEGRGMIEWSLQNAPVPTYMDDRGIHQMTATQAFGDFEIKSASSYIDPFLLTYRDSVVESVRVKGKNQYRLFMIDGSFIIGKVMPDLSIQFMPCSYGKVVRVASSGSTPSHGEITVFGSDDGFVYRADKGGAFDDKKITAYIRLAFTNCRTPLVNKAFRKFRMQVDAVDQPVMTYSFDLSFGATDIPSAALLPIAGDNIRVTGGYWGEVTWGDFIWGGQPVGEAEGYLDGTGYNISMMIRSESMNQPEHTIKSMTLYYNPRRLKR